MTTSRKRWYGKPPTVIVPEGIGLGYLAGLIDGEGCISDRRGRGLRIDLTNTSSELLDWLTSHVGGRVYRQRDRVPGRWKPVGDWILMGANARVILEAIEPYLTAKQAQAQSVLDSSPSLNEGFQRRPH